MCRMRVLLTGANGFLGRHLSSEFIRSGIELIKTTRKGDNNSVACDLNSKENVGYLINLVKPDLIVHSAAFVPKTLEDYKNLESSYLNRKMLENILMSSKVPLVYISSMTVYGNSKNIVRCESDAGSPESPYGVSKYEGELLLKEDGRDSLSIRIPGLFGEGRDSGLVNNILMNLSSEEDLELPKSPILWAAMDVKDAAKVIIRLVKNSAFKGYTPINVGYSEIYSINRLLAIYERIFHISIAYEINHPDFRFDLTLLKKFKVISNGNLKVALMNLKSRYEQENNK
jgi:nucleoside-diphosphate-sugar epimerase